MQANTLNRENNSFFSLLFAAFLLSILLHFALLYLASKFEPSKYGEKYYEQLVPRKFQVERVEIDPKLLEQDEDTNRNKEPLRPEIQLPQENVSNEKNSSLPQEPPKLEPTQILPNLQISADFLRDSFPQSQIPKENLANELEKLHDELLETSSPSSNRPILPLPEINNDSSPPTKLGMRFGSLAGYSELDDLLQKTGPLEKNTAPIFMPGDLLFDYDSAELRPEAIESLAKLGTLMLRNPNVRFRIEGHTDSFGPPDYNLNLSLRRAEAVKAWLIQHMGVPLDNIETRGYGSSRLIAPATGSIEEQQINRRVEIALEFLN